MLNHETESTDLKVRWEFNNEFLKLFFEEINKTSVKRSCFEKFSRAFKSRDYVVSLWEGKELIGFGSLLTDTMNSIIYDLVVVKKYQGQGHGPAVGCGTCNSFHAGAA